MPRRRASDAEPIEVAPLIQQAEQYAQSVREPEKRVALLCSQAIWRLRAGDAEGAEQALAEAQDAALSVPETWKRDGCISDCAGRLVVEGAIERAAQLTAEYLASEWGGRWAGAIAAQAFRAGAHDHARAFIRYWLEHYAPAAQQQFEQAISRAVDYGATAFALELLELTPAGTDLSFPLTMIAERLAQRRRFEEAMAFAERILLAHLRLEALNTIAEKALNSGQEALARQAIQQAYLLTPEARLAGQRALSNDWRLYQTGELLMHIGDVDAAQAIANQLSTQPANYLFQSIIHFYIEQDDFETAQRIAAESPHAPRAEQVQCYIAEHLARTGREAEAMRILERVSSVYHRDETLGRIAVMYARQGRLDEAQALLNQMQYSKEHTRYSVALALAEMQQFEPALQLLHDSDEPYYQNDALLKIVDAMAQQIEVDDALRILDAHRALRAYERGLLKLLKACAKRGDLARAGAILARLQNDKRRAQALAAIAQYHLQIGDWQTALQTAEQIPQLSTRDRLIAQIARARVRAGDFDGAAQVAQHILTPALLAETLYWIAEQTRP